MNAVFCHQPGYFCALRFIKMELAAQAPHEKEFLYCFIRVELQRSKHRRAHRSLRSPTANAKRVEEARSVCGREPFGDRVKPAELSVLVTILE